MLWLTKSKDPKISRISKKPSQRFNQPKFTLDSVASTNFDKVVTIISVWPCAVFHPVNLREMPWPVVVSSRGDRHYFQLVFYLRLLIQSFLLVDTGPEVSERFFNNPGPALVAVEGSSIKTYPKRIVTFELPIGRF